MILPAAPFDLERHMLAPLATGLPHMLALGEGRTVQILREPTMGPIIPDLLLGVWRLDRAPRAFPATTWIDAAVLALVEREGIVASDAIRGWLYLSANAAAASEARLLRNGLIVRAGDVSTDGAGTPVMQSWTLAPGAETTGLEIVAVEAKLSRWQDAVPQAASYLTFADRAYVALDGNRVRVTSALLAAVHAARVGLVLQHGFVLRHVVPAPLQPAPRTPERVLAATKLVTGRGGRAFGASNDWPTEPPSREDATRQATAAS